jgi:hypothetical protein
MHLLQQYRYSHSVTQLTVTNTPYVAGALWDSIPRRYIHCDRIGTINAVVSQVPHSCR